MKLLVIPARGGSKRIPRKNIKSFHGRPIIEWSIRAAISSNVFDQVMVSTDDEEIAGTAKTLGVRVPFMRPTELSGDLAGTQEVVRHAIEWFVKNESAPEFVCCLYATAPFVMPSDLVKAMALLEEGAVDFVVPVTSYAYPIQRALNVQADGRLCMIHPELAASRSQDLVQAYHDAGQFYCGTSSAWLSNRSVFNANTLAFQLPRYRVQDIDDLDDWTRAELMFGALHDRGRA
jgi:N-acylneuraminate cytidylyltransferase